VSNSCVSAFALLLRHLVAAGQFDLTLNQIILNFNRVLCYIQMKITQLFYKCRLHRIGTYFNKTDTLKMTVPFISNVSLTINLRLCTLSFVVFEIGYVHTGAPEYSFKAVEINNGIRRLAAHFILVFESQE
jgi:hypothetical protein